MSRIDYQNLDFNDATGLAEEIRQRRGGSLMNLDRMLLHSEPFARGWHGFLPAVRSDLSVDKKLAELAICLVAVLNGAEYEFHHHAPHFLGAGGSDEQLQALRSPEEVLTNDKLFSALELATLRLTSEMTRTIAVTDATFSAVRGALNDERQLVELVGVISAYNMVSRFLVALGVEPE